MTSLNYGVRVHPTNTPTVFRDTCTINESDLTAVPHDTSNNKNRLLGTVNFQKGIIYGATKKVGDDAISGTNIWGLVIPYGIKAALPPMPVRDITELRGRTSVT